MRLVETLLEMTMTFTQPPHRSLLGSLLLCSLLSVGLADMGAWTDGLEGSSVQLAEAVLISGSILAALSLVLLIIALLDIIGLWLRPRCCVDVLYPIAHIVLATLWLPVIGISGFLLSKDHYAAIGFVAAGGICVMLHVAVALTQLCWWYCARVSLASLTDHPKSALLTAPSLDQNRLTPGGMPPHNHHNHHHGGGGGVSQGPHGGAPGPGNNPFRATYGLLPGSSNVFAYHIFISEEENRPYTGLQSGPQQRPAGSPRRQKRVQPLISLQSAMQPPQPHSPPPPQQLQHLSPQQQQQPAQMPQQQLPQMQHPHSHVQEPQQHQLHHLSPQGQGQCSNDNRYDKS